MNVSGRWHKAARRQFQTNESCVEMDGYMQYIFHTYVSQVFTYVYAVIDIRATTTPLVLPHMRLLLLGQLTTTTTTTTTTTAINTTTATPKVVAVGVEEVVAVAQVAAVVAAVAGSSSRSRGGGATAVVEMFVRCSGCTCLVCGCVRVCVMWVV
jgi:hypothetical protein